MEENASSLENAFKMPARCRTCGKIIFSSNLNNLFCQPEKIMLHQIEVLTGLFLKDQENFPSYICGPCVISLREAIIFRERIIKTQQLLLQRKYAPDSLIENDWNEEERLQLDGDEKELDTEPEGEHDVSTTSNDKIIVYDYKCDREEDPEHETIAQPYEAAERIDSKPVEVPNNIYAKVNFAINSRNTPRINWSKLSEEEIVELKRARRKRDCICELCGRHFTCPSNFKVHLLRHTGVKNFACKQCPLKFYTPHLLRRHMLAHLCEKPYACQYCGQTFADHSGRIQHERNRHTNYKPYKCTKCDKAFAVSNKLKTHMLSHTGVRSFHCEVCKVSFMRRPHLAAHYRSKSHEQNVENSAAEPKNVDLVIENAI